ncbi:MAG: YbjN domain-containing protein, partial [Pseudomonadota bacterium]
MAFGYSNALAVEDRHDNPVDLIEMVATGNDWAFERSGEDEIAITVKGEWAEYDVSMSWISDFEALHLACA